MKRLRLSICNGCGVAESEERPWRCPLGDDATFRSEDYVPAEAYDRLRKALEDIQDELRCEFGANCGWGHIDQAIERALNA